MIVYWRMVILALYIASLPIIYPKFCAVLIHSLGSR